MDNSLCRSSYLFWTESYQELEKIRNRILSVPDLDKEKFRKVLDAVYGKQKRHESFRLNRTFCQIEEISEIVSHEPDYSFYIICREKKTEAVLYLWEKAMFKTTKTVNVSKVG